MAGESNLKTLERLMAPVLHPDRFVFCCFADFAVPDGVHPLCLFKEQEGLTAIVEMTEALSVDLHYQFEARLITLSVQSALGAVGFMASVLQVLAAEGVACNVISAFHHDHLFVPAELAELAMRTLRSHSERSTRAR